MSEQPKVNEAARSRDARTKIDRYWEQISRHNHFQIFGGSTEIEGEALKTMYKTLAKQWHADAYAGIDLGDARETLDTIFQRIQQAYEVLQDPGKRSEYKVMLQRQSQGLSTDVNSILKAEQLFDEGLAQMRRRAWADATKSFEDAIKLNPDDPLLPVNLAWSRFNLNRKDQKVADAAVEMLKKSTQKHGNVALTWQYLGQIGFTLNRVDEAKKAWKRCLEIEPKNLEATRGLRLLTSRQQQEASGFTGLIKNLFKKK